MPAYLLTWNPDKWPWTELANDIQQFTERGTLTRRWSCGSSKRIRAGDRVFFCMQGNRGRGLYASGYAQGESFVDQHFADNTKTSRYITVTYDALVNPWSDRLDREQLEAVPLNLVRWGTQVAGIGIPTHCWSALETTWSNHLRSKGLDLRDSDFPDSHDLVFVEGHAHPTTVMVFERSREARTRCIAAKGSNCKVCGLSFGAIYGQMGAGFIHVHHTSTLGSGNGARATDALRDLEPVCPNCHCMLHRRTPPYTIEELRRIMREQAETRRTEPGSA